MPLRIVHQDITKIRCNAIVNPTDQYYSGSGGADLAIHRAAGKELSSACRRLPALEQGSVAVTPGFNLPADYIFHTMGPIWLDGRHNETILLRSCYLNSLMKAGAMGLETIAFPLISSGTFGFPKDRVLQVAIEAIKDYLYTSENDLDVYICILDRSSYELSKERALRSSIASFTYVNHAVLKEETEDSDKQAPPLSEKDQIEYSFSSYAEAFSACDSEEESCPPAASSPELYQSPSSVRIQASRPAGAKATRPRPRPLCAQAPAPAAERVPKAKKPSVFDNGFFAGKAEKKEEKEESLEKWLRKQDECFSVLLLKLIDRKGMTDVECYKKANISKQTFSKIKNEAKYRPKKHTVLAFAIALELTITETEQLMKAAGLALTHSTTFDLIIEFYITQQIYDVYEINAALYKYDQPCLGCEE